ncbi:MAG TPA: ATP-binding protein, partial [Candidatus Brocadiales bacterium]|nr:ATP-binding protein [Candidatus Brocadiales bacterium]
VRVKQILYNLVSNAIKFTPDKGRVLITTRRITDGVDSIEISVKDTGIGIAPEDFDKIFASFRQIDGSYSRKQEGTGLGLSLTKKLVELHGGRIWFESEVGKGSTFYVTISVNGLPNMVKGNMKKENEPVSFEKVC